MDHPNPTQGISTGMFIYGSTIGFFAEFWWKKSGPIPWTQWVSDLIKNVFFLQWIDEMMSEQKWRPWKEEMTLHCWHRGLITNRFQTIMYPSCRLLHPPRKQTWQLNSKLETRNIGVSLHCHVWFTFGYIWYLNKKGRIEPTNFEGVAAWWSWPLYFQIAKQTRKLRYSWAVSGSSKNNWTLASGGGEALQCNMGHETKFRFFKKFWPRWGSTWFQPATVQTREWTSQFEHHSWELQKVIQQADLLCFCEIIKVMASSDENSRWIETTNSSFQVGAAHCGAWILWSQGRGACVTMG